MNRKMKGEEILKGKKIKVKIGDFFGAEELLFDWRSIYIY